MDISCTQGLVDCHGRPVEARIARAIDRLLPRLLRHFPVLRDDTLLIDVVDRAGRRLSTREERMGTIERLDGYTWATLRTIATSVLRQGSARLVQNTLQGIRGERQLSVLACTSGAPEDIERAILLQEVLQMLPPDVRHIVLCKLAGLSSLDIAKRQARSVSAINTSLCRAKKKLRQVLQQSSRLGP